MPGLATLRRVAIGYFTEGGKEWNGKSISAGAVTDPLRCLGYARKTIYFLSDTAGTLSIEVQEPDGEWRVYDSVSVTPNELVVYVMTADALSLRLRFDTAAKVTAWYILTSIG